MASLEQRNLNTRVIMAIMIAFFVLIFIGQATFVPLLKYNNGSVFSNVWYTVIITFTMFSILIGVYLALRIVRDTYSDIVF